MNKIIAVNPSNTQPTLTLTLESTGILLGILVSVSMLLGGTIKVITKFNTISNSIRDLREDLNSNTKALEQFKTLNSEVLVLDRKLDLHLQEYVNRKETVQFLMGQLDQKIDHNRKRWEEELQEVKGETKQLENYLQSHSGFKVRE
ncbi:hypothetical protein [Nostoc sp. TCL26-01]|uniref:hypothetical protein n=1 Tax=Nostoc sp. TCL26-01 TaxID=2576904 RepID=UPI0015B8E805|nr:hypothetical protein [Nostoc sp. TCL26-01]QLE54839.1 hypothetical protein FD725_04500 [Nostoc sp. TCL26-01]QLE58767.1 hypothetical protein FD725_26645 [Nostoc sp. TCL26-01]